MFQTEKLTQIIDQLQHTEGMTYFETLRLIAKLIGLFIKPIMFFAFIVFAIYWIPKKLSIKLKPLSAGEKAYNLKLAYSSENNLFTTLNYEHSLIRTTNYYDKLMEREKLRYILTGITFLLSIFFVSPFFFINMTIMILTMLPIIIFGFVYITEVLIYNCTGIGFNFDEEEFDSADIERKAMDKINRQIQELSKEQKKSMNVSELECYLNEKLDSEIFLVSLRQLKD